MSQDLATLVLRLEAEISQYQTKLTLATNLIQKFQHDTKSALDDVKGYFEKTFEVAAIYEFSKTVEEFAASTIESVASLTRLSQAAGISVEALSSLRLAAAASGLSQDQLAESFKKLNVSIAEAAGDPTSKAAAAFKALGVSVTNVDGSLKSAGQALPDIANAFAASADGPAKAAIAVDLFGRAGTSMIPVLNGGAQALDEFRQKAEAAGLVISTQTSKAAEEFTTKVGILKASLIDGFALQVESQLLPVLDRLVDDLTASGGASDLLKAAASVLVFEFKLLAEQLLIVGGALKLVYDVGATAFKTVGDLATLDLKSSGKDLADGFANAGNTITGTAKAVDDLWIEGGAQADAYKKKAEAAAGVKIKAPEVPDFSGSFEGLSGVDLSKVGQGLSRGLTDARGAIGSTSTAVDTLWKSADASAAQYYDVVEKSSKTPILDPAVIADQQKLLAGLGGPDLSHVGKDLGDGFAAAKDPVTATWKAATDSADAYSAQVENIAKTPIVDTAAVTEQEQGILGLGVAWRTASTVASAVWKVAGAAARSYFDDVAEGSKTPLIDPAVVDGQQKALEGLHGADLGGVGRSLADGFVEARAPIDATWKAAQASAGDYLGRVEAISRTPIIDPQAIDDQQKALARLDDVDLSGVGAALGKGFAQADTAVAAAATAVGNLWKSADASAGSYFADVLAGSKAPIVDASALAGIKAIDGINLGGVGATLADGFAKADPAVGATSAGIADLWKSADDASAEYFARLKVDSKTPIVDQSVVGAQSKIFDGLQGVHLGAVGQELGDGFARADAAVATTSTAITGLWKQADASADIYFRGVEAGSQTPIIDADVVSAQAKTLAALSGVDLSKVGAGLATGFTQADASLATTDAMLAALWKSADTSATAYYDVVAAGNKTPIIDPKVVRDQQSALDALHGADLAAVGRSLADGFTAARTPVDATWKAAQASAADYLARVEAISKTPIVDPRAIADQRDALAGLNGVDLRNVGGGLSEGFARADAAVADASTAVRDLWKTADASADDYFTSVLRGSKTPIVDPSVIVDQQKDLDGLRGADLTRIGKSLGDGFAAAKAPITSTWSVAQESASDYLAQVSYIAKTPIIDVAAVKDQSNSVGLLGVAWRTATTVADALWKGAKLSAADYFGSVESRSKTPIIDASVFAEQRKALTDLQNNTHLGDVGKQLGDGLSESAAALMTVSADVDTLWKSAGDSAEGFFDKLRTSGSVLPQLVTPAQIAQQEQAQKKVEEFAAGIQAQAQSFGLGAAAATAFKLSIGALGDAVTLAHKTIDDMLTKGIIPFNQPLLDAANATLKFADASKAFSAQLQGEQDVKSLKDFVAAIQQQSIAFDQGALASTNFKLSTGAIGEAVDRATKTLAALPAGTQIAKGSVEALAAALLSLVANARSASVALQQKLDSREIENYTSKLNEQLLKYGQSDVAAVDFTATTGKLGQALRSGSEEAIAATAHIHDLAVELTLAKDKDALFNVDQEILTMTGHLSEAAKAAFEFQNKLLIKNISATGDPGTQKQIDDLKKLGVTQEQYNDAVERAAQLQANEAATEATIREAQTKNGQLTLAGQNAINAARLTEHQQLEQLKVVAAAYGQQQLDTLANLKKALGEYNDLQRESTNIRANESLTQSAINLQIAKGQETTINGQKQIADAYGAEAEQLQVIYDKLYALGQSSGLVEIQDQAKALKVELNDLQAKAIDPLATKLRTDFVDSAADAWTSFVTGAKTAHQALTDFLTSFESEIIKLASKNLLESLFKTDSGGGGLGSIFSSLAGLLGGGSNYGVNNAVISGVTQNGGIGGGIGSIVDSLAGGGPVSAGSRYIVGEHGAEEFVPKSDGMIVPNGKMSRGDTIHQYNFNIQAVGGNVSKPTRDQIALAAYTGAQRAMRRNG